MRLNRPGRRPGDRRRPGRDWGDQQAAASIGSSRCSMSTMCIAMYWLKLRMSCSCCAGDSDRCAALRCVRNVCSAVLTAQVSLGGGGEDAVGVGVGVGSVVVGVGVGVGVLVPPVTVTAAVMSGCTAQ